MNEVVELYGEFGKGSSQPYNAPVTLRSKQVVYMLFVVSEGELTSIEDILVNDVSLSNYTASFAFTYGTVSQDKIPYLNNVAVAEGFSLPIVKESSPGNPSEGVIRPILGSFEFVDVSITLASLVYNDTAGNSLENTVSFEIFVSPTSIIPVYTSVATPTITGKAIQPYVFDTRIRRPVANDGLTDWQIKIVRISNDSDQYNNSSSSLTALTYYSNNNVSNYPGSALIAIRMEDASEVGNSIPNISFKGHGVKLMLPDSSYYRANPPEGEEALKYRNITNNAWVSSTDVNRETWDGTWHTVATIPTYQYCNNLSWVLYNLLSDWLYFEVNINGNDVRFPRGLDTPKTRLAHYSFEAFARYCDEMLEYTDPVSNVTVTEPRYTLNMQFIQREDAQKAVDTILSVGSANLVEEGGLLTVIWDRPFTATEIATSLLFTNQNVVDGLFEYASTDITENYTQINVTIQEIDNRNRTRTLTLYSSELASELSLADTYFVDKYGYTSSDFLVLGTSSVAAGIRKGRRLLWEALMTDLEGDGIVKFKSIIEAALLHKGSCIRIHDSNVFNTVETGRIVSSTSTNSLLTIVLDRSITLNGVTNLLVYKEDGSLLDLLLNETTGSHTTVTADVGETTNLILQSLFVVKTDRTTTYVVTNVTKDDEYYTVEAIKYDARKYDFIDNGVILPEANGFVETLSGKTPKVTNISIIDYPHATDIEKKHFDLTWEHATLPDRVYTYQVEWNVSTGQSGASTVHSKNFTFAQTVPVYGATYYFTITAQSSLDLPSKPVSFSFIEKRWDMDGLTWDSGETYAV